MCKYSHLLTGSIQTRLKKTRALHLGAPPLKPGRDPRIQIVELRPISSVCLASIKLLHLLICKVYNLKLSTHLLGQSVLISCTIINM